MTAEDDTSHMPIPQLKLKITKGNIQQEPYTHSLPLSLVHNDSSRTNSSGCCLLTPKPSTITGAQHGLSSTQNHWERGRPKTSAPE